MLKLWNKLTRRNVKHFAAMLHQLKPLNDKECFIRALSIVLDTDYELVKDRISLTYGQNLEEVGFQPDLSDGIPRQIAYAILDATASEITLSVKNVSWMGLTFDELVHQRIIKPTGTYMCEYYDHICAVVDGTFYDVQDYRGQKVRNVWVVRPS